MEAVGTARCVDRLRTEYPLALAWKSLGVEEARPKASRGQGG